MVAFRETVHMVTPHAIDSKPFIATGTHGEFASLMTGICSNKTKQSKKSFLSWYLQEMFAFQKVLQSECMAICLLCQLASSLQPEEQLQEVVQSTKQSSCVMSQQHPAVRESLISGRTSHHSRLYCSYHHPLFGSE